MSNSIFYGEKFILNNHLINKVKSGDTHAFKKLFESYKDQIYNLCFRFVNTREEAEDLCQEVFFKIYKSIDSFKSRSKLSTWIYRITVNLCLNYKRKENKFRRLFEGDSFEGFGSELNENLSAPLCDRPDFFLEQKEREKIVQQAINSLPSNQRVALILQRYEGMSIQEIAEVLGCSVSSIQSRLSRAKENLCKRLMPFLDEIL